MELSKFLQQDIIEFLEKKSSEQRERRVGVRAEEFSIFDVERDYAKETEQALADNKLSEAKKIFDHLRETYNTLEGRDEEREKVYAVLEEVYSKIKESVSKGKTLEEDLKEFEEGMLKTTHERDSTAAFEKEALAAQGQRKKLDEQLKTRIENIHQELSKGEVNNAIKEYAKLKATFQQYPSDDKFRKVEWYNQVLGTYELISKERRKQQEKLKEEQERTAEENRKKAALAQEEAKKKAAVEHARSFVKQLINKLESGDIHEMERMLIGARHKVAKLDKDQSEAKQSLDYLLSVITNRIQFLKKEQEIQAAAQKAKLEAEKKKHAEEERRKAQEQAKIAAQRREAAEKEAKEAEKRRLAAAKLKGNAEELYQEGLKHQHEGDTKTARTFYEQVLKVSPHHLPAQIRLEQISEQEAA